MTAPNASSQFPRPRAPLSPGAPASNPELNWIAEMNLSIDRERHRLNLKPRHDRRKPS